MYTHIYNVCMYMYPSPGSQMFFHGERMLIENMAYVHVGP